MKWIVNPTGKQICRTHTPVNQLNSLRMPVSFQFSPVETQTGIKTAETSTRILHPVVRNPDCFHATGRELFMSPWPVGSFTKRILVMMGQLPFTTRGAT